MKNHCAILLGAWGILAAGAAPALAGPCAQQLSDLRKLVSAQDAGSGPVTPHPGQGVTDQQNTAASQPGAGNTVSNKAMSDATKTTAASDQDVRRQETNQPTASQQASGASSSDDRLGRIDSAIKDATMLDNQGDSTCKAKVQEAQHLLENRLTQ